MSERRVRDPVTLPLPAALRPSRKNVDVVGRTLVNRFRVVAPLAEGGMGTVYRAHDLVYGGDVAVKVLRAGVHDREVAKRFEREAWAASALKNQHIVEVFDFGALEDGTLYLAMELLVGPSVGELIDARGLSPRRTLVIARQVLDALSRAHAYGIVHRDLKPDNVIVTRAGEGDRAYDHVKLLDFGLVKLLGQAAAAVGADPLSMKGYVFGTPAYMAPEQASGGTIDGRTDLYALGVILFEMLTGEKPFQHPDAHGLLRLHLERPAPRLSSRAGEASWCTPEMEALVAVCLEKLPDRRWADARSMQAALDEAFRSIDHVER